MTVSMMILPEAFAATPTDLKQINHKIETLKAILSKEKTNEDFFEKIKNCKNCFRTYTTSITKKRSHSKKRIATP